MEDPKLHPGHEEKPGTKASPGVRAPAAGESSSSDIRSDPNAQLDSDQPLDVGATLAGQSFTPVPHPVRPLTNTRLQPGDIIGGRYEILELLGEGGMGAVYKASDRELSRFVALKLIRSDLASNPAILARFKQELLTAHQVTHKNVIRIYDLAEADDVKFITMEYIEGCDLRRLLLDEGKLPPERAIEIIRQVCLALDAAHSVGVIHRDLKPQNIMCQQSWPNPGHGFWVGPLHRVKGHDPDRRLDGNHRIHVPGTIHGEATGRTLRFICHRTDFL